MVTAGVETRIPLPARSVDGAGLRSRNTHWPYPAGEGYGQAGGIMTAGIDGILRVAEALALDHACRPRRAQDGS